MTKLSDTAQLILHGAANHEHGLARGPLKLPTAARNAVFKSLLKQNMLVEINAPKEYVGLGWRQDEAGVWVALRITDEGFRAIGIDPNARQAGEMGEPDASGIEGSVPDGERIEIDAAFDPATGTAGAAPLAEEIALLDETLARIAKPAHSAFVVTFSCEMDADTAARIARILRDHGGTVGLALDGVAPLATKPSREQRATRAPRAGTKQDTVLALLARDEGATGAQIAEATGWADNTVRGFLAGLKKKGHEVEVIDRVRMVGPNKTGAKGSYTVYRIGKEG